VMYVYVCAHERDKRWRLRRGESSRAVVTATTTNNSRLLRKEAEKGEREREDND